MPTHRHDPSAMDDIASTLPRRGAPFPSDSRARLTQPRSAFVPPYSEDDSSLSDNDMKGSTAAGAPSSWMPHFPPTSVLQFGFSQSPGGVASRGLQEDKGTRGDPTIDSLPAPAPAPLPAPAAVSAWAAWAVPSPRPPSAATQPLHCTYRHHRRCHSSRRCHTHTHTLTHTHTHTHNHTHTHTHTHPHTHTHSHRRG
jgi:hypothetical protein